MLIDVILVLVVVLLVLVLVLVLLLLLISVTILAVKRLLLIVGLLISLPLNSTAILNELVVSLFLVHSCRLLRRLVIRLDNGSCQILILVVCLPPACPLIYVALG